MTHKEYYYQADQYDCGGIDPFLTHVTQYLAGIRTVPVTRAPSVSHQFLYFTFSNDLHSLFLNDLSKVKKPYECALKYGFGGYSKGRKNGVFLLRTQDSGLADSLQTLKDKSKLEIVQDLDCSTHDIRDLRAVKIVCHNPSGERAIGVMNPLNGRAIFLGFGQY